MRSFLSFTPVSVNFRDKVIDYCRTMDHAVVLESRGFPGGFADGPVGMMASFGALDLCKGSFNELISFHREKRDWLFGYFSYDLKNSFEKLQSVNSSTIQFGDLCFFQPRFILVHHSQGWSIGYHCDASSEEEALNVVKRIDSTCISPSGLSTPVEVHSRTSKDRYLRNVELIKEHIHRGDVYEMNYCIEFFNQHAFIDSYVLYRELLELSPVPFGALVKNKTKYLICASPERFLKKKGPLLVSQPIKGTASRHDDPDLDWRVRSQLENDPKEKSENIMITDLVRNDLSKVASRGSVRVDELCSVYSYRQVHQMISTISARLKTGLHWSDAVKATFPMGSMTGAPKIKAMELIDQFEDVQRGLYSGSVGYISPEGDFDFNVVIRSIFYDQRKHYLSYLVGSAITSLSDPHKEYDECILKAQAMNAVLNHANP